jgi:hypothetical protein
MKGQDAESLAGVWDSVGSWYTSISVTIGLMQQGQRGLQECWGSVGSLFTSISKSILLEQVGQRGLQECWRSAQRWLTSISESAKNCPHLTERELEASLCHC